MPEGGILSGQSALVNLAGWVPSEMVVADPLALHLRLPTTPRFAEKNPKPFTGRGRLASERNQRLNELRSLFKLARHYHTVKEESEKRRQPSPIVDTRLEALGPYLRKEKPVICHANTSRDIRAAIDFAEELGVRLILAGCRDAWKVAHLLKEKQIPVIVGPVLTECGASYDPYDAPFSNLAKLHEAGVEFCVQSDDASNARNLPFHAAMAVAYGLPPEEGLKAVTLYSAKILGVEKDLGSLTEGKIANLIVTDGDPLQASTNIVHLFIDGQPIAPTSKHTDLYQKYRARILAAGPPPSSETAPPDDSSPAERSLDTDANER
jgi:imidazolonepropionase-like amidohydrolase